ncbi:hypothetical protein V8C40DRAFT_122768 [Trichoderma camerunense]
MEFFPHISIAFCGVAWLCRVHCSTEPNIILVSIGSDKAGSVVVDPALSLPVFPHLTPHGYMKKSETLNAT